MIQSNSRDEFERNLLSQCASGAFDRAATAVIDGYGPEIFGFLIGLMHDEEGAREVFAIFCEDFWRGLPRFQWSSSLRTWAYTLARHALYRFEGERARRRRGHVPLSQVDDLDRMSQRPLSGTQTYLRTDCKTRIAEIRSSLDREQQMLLILRHDRDLSWPEIAQVLSSDRSWSDAELKREAAALRKRYERLLRHLRELYHQARHPE
jgi:RNA polymerase sigma-70 factor (ECF subfamily)